MALLLFSAVLLGVGIHHLVATGTCSSTGYSANYGPVPTCPSGTGWWFAFVFGGIIGSLIGALMAGSAGLVFAGIFGAIGFGALSAPPRTPTATSAFGTSEGATAFGMASEPADPIRSAYDASRNAAAAVPPPTLLNLVPGLQAAKQAAARDPIDELAKLADLHQKGALTDEEFANAKTKLLGHL